MQFSHSTDVYKAGYGIAIYSIDCIKIKHFDELKVVSFEDYGKKAMEATLNGDKIYVVPVEGA